VHHLLEQSVAPRYILFSRCSKACSPQDRSKLVDFNEKLAADVRLRQLEEEAKKAKEAEARIKAERETRVHQAGKSDM
jgi:hypothetical protein